MYNRLIKFINKANIITNHQFGFRSNFGTSDAITEYLDVIYDTINKSQSLLTVFLDFSKAFDTVNLEILLQKLEHYGVRGIVNAWFRTFLMNRPRYVSVNRFKSDVIECNIGVPQGSTLGPLLFIIYINDMHNSSKLLNVIHFAADTTAFIPCEDVCSQINLIEADLVRLSEWMICNRLSLNIQKTSFMIHGTHNLSNAVDLHLNGEKLTRVNQAKFLGVIIDDQVKFDLHADFVLKKLSIVSGIIWKSKNVLPKRTLKTLYLSLGWSYINYGVLAWGGANLTSISKIKSAQNKIIRNIYGNCERATYKRYRILTFDDTYELFSLIKLYKEIKTPVNENTYFFRKVVSLQSQHNYNTRFAGRGNLTTPIVRKSKFFNSFIYRSIHYWNRLPPTLRNLSTIKQFKKNVRQRLFDRI